MFDRTTLRQVIHLRPTEPLINRPLPAEPIPGRFAAASLLLLVAIVVGGIAFGCLSALAQGYVWP
jgi:hypothetical protein